MVSDKSFFFFNLSVKIHTHLCNVKILCQDWISVVFFALIYNDLKMYYIWILRGLLSINHDDVKC